MPCSQYARTLLESTWDMAFPPSRPTLQQDQGLDPRHDRLLSGVPELCGYKVLGPVALYASLQ